MSDTKDLKFMFYDTNLNKMGTQIISCEVLSPDESERGGQGLAILYGFGSTPIGELLVGWTSRGVCHVAFVASCVANYDEQMVSELKAYWPQAIFTQDDQAAMQLLSLIFPLNHLRESQAKLGKVNLLLKGTPFQIKVWQALMHIDFGRVISYKQLAIQAGYPKAARAVGSALAVNRVGFLIPCHRVIRQNGETGQYRWGDARKKALLAWEATQMVSRTNR
jgi:AraC family transcriptional regulator of adaptative response/methylated-DNA-[protein]-cysteine methyltransferase